MATGRSLQRFVLALALLVSLVSCRGRTLDPASTEPVRIGVVLPASGSLGTDGMAWVRGIQLAVSEVNAAGGVLPGRRVELLIEDSETDATAAVMRARDLVDNRGAVAILGDGGSAASLAVYTMVTRDARVPQVSCCSTSPSLSVANSELAPEDRFFFRTAPSDELQARALVRLAYENAGCTSLAILHIDDDYGTPFAAAIEQIFPDEGAGTVVSNVAFADGQANYDSVLGPVLGAAPDCNVIIGYPRNAGTILQDWERLGGSDVDWIGTDGLKSPELATAVASGARLDGFWGTAPLTTPMTMEFNEFAARYRAAFNHDPEPFVSSSYDSAALVLLAIAAAGSTDGDAIRDAIHTINDTSAGSEVVQAAQLAFGLQSLRDGDTINYVGASGPLDLDELGNPLAPYEVWQWQQSADDFVQVRVFQPADLAP